MSSSQKLTFLQNDDTFSYFNLKKKDRYVFIVHFINFYLSLTRDENVINDKKEYKIFFNLKHELIFEYVIILEWKNTK